MKVFFSYGDEKYKNSKNRIKLEAENSGFFDKINIFSRQDISDDFLEKTTPFIDHPRGGGYWLWKPFFLKKLFDEINDGDIVIYADAGCHINANGRNRFEYLIELLDLNPCGILGYRIQPEDEYTNEKVFEHFSIEKNDWIRNSRQLMATILYLKKCPNTTNIVNEYYETAIKFPNLFSDDYNEYKKTAVFKDHRHDQSILSILRKKYGCVIIPDETFANDWRELMHVPILATRIRN
jgi:hypothetical protein